MPHSTVPFPSPNVAQEDSILPDAPSHTHIENEAQSSSEDAHDNGVAQSPKNNMDLEDMFDDDEDDEEFASSAAANGKTESSPPAAPV